MATVQVHAGDFIHGSAGQFTSVFGSSSFMLKTDAHRFLGESIPATDLDCVEIASEESVKRLGGTIGWGLIGGALLGPAGMLAGLLLGGRKTQVTFVARFKDGRKLLGTTDSKTFTAMQAACFK